MNQWAIRILDLREKWLERGDELNWFPLHMKNRYDNWVKGLKWDWNISRQIFFGVPFPVWYCEKCEKPVMARKEDLPVDPTVDKCHLDACPCGHTSFVGEDDIINTWATSSLTPQLAIKLISEEDVQQKLYPMSLRPQAHDIISFWLFNTVVKAHLHYNSLPWHDVMISGWALDPHGKKMSKSKGNVIAPQAMIDKYSADALRFWAGGCKLGDDLPFQEKDLVTGKKTVTKLWNACKFALMHLEDYTPGDAPDLEEVDKWILSEMNKLIAHCTESFDKYEYSRIKQEVDKFFWKTICDNYLEIVKDRLYNPDSRGKEARKSGQHTLYLLLLNTLKLFAPIMPFITEELYQVYFKQHEGAKSIHVSSWPVAEETDDSLKLVGETVLYAVDAARKAKTEKQVSLRTPIKKFVIKSKLSKVEFKKIYADIKAATNALELSFEQIPAESKIDFEHEIELGEAQKK